MEVLKENLLNINIYSIFSYRYTSLSQRNLLSIIATICYFMLEGLFTGLWSISFADIKIKFNLSDSSLGNAVFITYIGTLIIIPVSNILLQQIGCKYRLLMFSLIYCLLYINILSTNSIEMFFIISFLYGLTWGIIDITANQSAVLTEIVSGTTLLGYYHGSYSLSASLGSTIGGILKSYDIELDIIFLIFTLFGCILTIIANVFLYDIKQEICIESYSKSVLQSNELHTVTNNQKNLKWNISYLCYISFLSSFCESSIILLCVLFYDKILNATTTERTTGFTWFMIAMACGRFSCDYMRSKYGRKILFFSCSLLVNIGLATVLLSIQFISLYQIRIASIGFATIGLGLSIIVPLSYSTAGQTNIKIWNNSALSMVAISSYSGFIISAPILGFISDYYESIIYSLVFDLILVSFMIPVSILLLRD